MEFIEQHLPEGVGGRPCYGGDDGTIALVAVSGELENMAGAGRRREGRPAGGAAAASKALEAGAAGGAKKETETKDAGCQAAPPSPSSAAATWPGLLPLLEQPRDPARARATYPGLFPALLEHEGVGVVLAYEGDGTPIVWGKTGNRNLRTGAVEGDEPLKMYGDPSVRAEQLCRLADFPNNGDLTVFSTVYADGTVAAMEELIGSHGGMGGVQTDAFLFHPAAIQVPPITNATGVFQVLDARRRAPVMPGELPKPVKEATNSHPPSLGRHHPGARVATPGRACAGAQPGRLRNSSPAPFDDRPGAADRARDGGLGRAHPSRWLQPAIHG